MISAPMAFRINLFSLHISLYRNRVIAISVECYCVLLSLNFAQQMDKVTNNDSCGGHLNISDCNHERIENLGERGHYVHKV